MSGKMKNRRFKISKIWPAILVIGLMPGSLLPGSATWANEPNYLEELDAATAQETFMDFRAAIEKDASGKSYAVLYGAVFESCLASADDFSIGNTSQGSGDSLQSGFVIADSSGKIQSCMAEMRAAGKHCRKTEPCKSLSSVPGGRIELKDVSQSVALFHQDPNKDPSAPREAELFTTPEGETLKMEGSKDRRARLDRQREEDRQQRIQAANRGFDACRKVPNGIDQAKDFLVQLERLRGIDEAETARRRALLVNAEFTAIAKAASECNPGLLEEEKIEAVWAKALEFAEDHPNTHANRVAGEISGSTARCILRNEDLSMADFRSAKGVLEEASRIKGVNAATKKQIEDLKLELATGIVRFAAKGDKNARKESRAAYTEIMKGLEKEIRSACRNVKDQESAIACAEAYRDASETKQNLDRDVYQNQMHEAMMQQQIQALMTQAMAPQPALPYGISPVQQPMSAGPVQGTLPGINPLPLGGGASYPANYPTANGPSGQLSGQFYGPTQTYMYNGGQFGQLGGRTF